MQQIPLRCQGFTLIGMIFISEDNRSLLEKPSSCHCACSSFGNGTLYEREKCVISQRVPTGLSRPTGIEHMLNTPPFPALQPQGAFLCVLLPGLIEHLWSLNSPCCLHWEDKKKRPWGPANFKNRSVQKKATQIIISGQIFKIIPRHHIHHESRGRMIFPEFGFFCE